MEVLKYLLWFFEGILIHCITRCEYSLRRPIWFFWVELQPINRDFQINRVAPKVDNLQKKIKINYQVKHLGTVQKY